MLRRRIAKRMYAVSAEGFGIISGTMAYSRRQAIAAFQAQCVPGSFALDWSSARHAGYRTVKATVKIIER